MKKDNIFWVGYSDLMTSLFFIMLVFFVLTFGYLNKKMEELKISKITLVKENSRLKKLLNLEQQFAPLIKEKGFRYLPECKKFLIEDLMGVEIFDPSQVTIKPDFTDKTIAAGKKIENFLQRLIAQKSDFSYLLVIEGNMANKYDRSISMDQALGYYKSYQRALAVYELWLQQGINFRQYNVEVLICGSGFNGLCRDTVEENNKRFSIQIIPKVSKE